MTDKHATSEHLFSVSAEEFVVASPEDVYAVVSDLPRSGEWSPECLGGDWVGEPAAVGAVFRGRNTRAADVVGWAPVVRGDWITQARVVVAEPGRHFRWSMLDKAGNPQESLWGFDVDARPGGSLLRHHFWMGRPTEGIRGITGDMDEPDKRRFFSEWSAKIKHDLDATLKRIKAVVENG